MTACSGCSSPSCSSESRGSLLWGKAGQNGSSMARGPGGRARCPASIPPLQRERHCSWPLPQVGRVRAGLSSLCVVSLGGLCGLGLERVLLARWVFHVC